MLGGSTAQISRSLKAIIKDRPRGSRLYTPIDRQTDRQTQKQFNNHLFVFVLFSPFLLLYFIFFSAERFPFEKGRPFFLKYFVGLNHFKRINFTICIAKLTPFFNVLTAF